MKRKSLQMNPQHSSGNSVDGLNSGRENPITVNHIFRGRRGQTRLK